METEPRKIVETLGRLTAPKPVQPSLRLQARHERLEQRDNAKAMEAAAKLLERRQAAEAPASSRVRQMLEELQRADVLNLVARRILDLLPPVLRGLAMNLPNGAGVQLAGDHLVACLKGETGGHPQVYWGTPGTPVGGGQWSGVYRDFDGLPQTIDVSVAAHILGCYLCRWTGMAAASVPPPGGDGTGLQSGWYWTDTQPTAGSGYYWRHVADLDEETGIRTLNANTAGDIVCPVPIPTYAYQVLQQGTDTAGDRGVVGDYVRAHA